MGLRAAQASSGGTAQGKQRLSPHSLPVPCPEREQCAGAGVGVLLPGRRGRGTGAVLG